MIKNKRAQEEIVGFVLIIVMVMVAILFILGFYLRGDHSEGMESYEAESFLQSALQYTTECGNYRGYFSVQELIGECSGDGLCQDGKNACEVLNLTMSNLTRESWDIGENRPVKGYSLSMEIGSRELISIKEGRESGDFRGTLQILPKNSIEVRFRAYYGD